MGLGGRIDRGSLFCGSIGGGPLGDGLCGSRVTADAGEAVEKEALDRGVVKIISEVDGQGVTADIQFNRKAGIILGDEMAGTMEGADIVEISVIDLNESRAGMWVS